MRARQKFGTREHLLVWGTLIAAIILTEVADFSHKIEDSFIYTVMIFTITVAVLNHLWRRARFWLNMAIALALHVFFLVSVVRILPANWRGIPGLFMMIGAMTEGLLIAGLVHKYTTGWKSNAGRTPSE